MVLALALVACGGPGVGAEHAGPQGAPPEITEESFHQVMGAYWRMDPESPARIAWRDALMAYLARDAEALIEREDYDAVVQRLATLSELLTPDDVEAGRVPAEVVPLARFIVAHGSPRGDEGRVMGALMLLSAVGEDAEAHRAERERVARWGRSVRQGMANPIERYQGLLQVWEQHEELAPDPEVLEILARLYVEQRDALTGVLGPDGEETSGRARMRLDHLQLVGLLVRRAPLDVAAVYLRHGDLVRAIQAVQRMGGGEGGVEQRLVVILQRARENNEEGATALDSLAQGFVRARPTISAAICRLGARRFPEDGRFPLCLGRVAIVRERFGEATSWYAEAVRLEPDDQEIHEEALAQLEQLIESDRFEEAVGSSRRMADSVLELLSDYRQRWPDETPPVTRDVVLMHIARAEMSAGNIAAARERLVESLALRESAEAHRDFGLLLERTGQPEEAATHYRQALDLTPAAQPEDQLARAGLLEDLGDTFRQAGDAARSRRMYRQALELWARLSEAISPARRAIADVRIGVLQSRLGEEAAAAEAFERAMRSGPSWRGPYAEILSHLVVAAPNVELAQRVLRRATYQLTLEREWRVYFALWVQAIAARAAHEPDNELGVLLGDLARGDGWSASLAAFGHSDMSDEELMAAASNPGERAEALFYAGTRSLAAGDVGRARERFQEVLDTRMVSFYEYAMAQELLAGLPGSTSTPATARRTER